MFLVVYVTTKYYTDKQNRIVYCEYEMFKCQRRIVTDRQDTAM